jgi:hypothetical protein
MFMQAGTHYAALKSFATHPGKPPTDAFSPMSISSFFWV